MKINSSISEIDKINEEEEPYYERHNEHKPMEVSIDKDRNDG